MTALLATLRRLIETEGPLPVDRYMALCLGDPARGYYATRDPFGAAGDFVTAPEISQIFGEMIGLWAAAEWEVMGRPAPVRLVELGPGRGTLMADALRAARVMPGFLEAARVHLVETSRTLRDVQVRTLSAFEVPRAWHGGLDTVPPGPAIVIANEFFDALPVRQLVRGEDGWRERVVTLTPRMIPAFAAGGRVDAALVPAALRDAEPGAILEVAEAAARIAEALGRRLAGDGGVALVIDYGHARTAAGDTLQAVKRHRFVDPLAEPGEADLTAHVDFEALAAAARRGGAEAWGPVPQRDLLIALGAETRADMLKRSAGIAQAIAIDAALARLTDPAPTGMGALFKALALAHPALPRPAGFVQPSSRTP